VIGYKLADYKKLRLTEKSIETNMRRL